MKVLASTSESSTPASRFASRVTGRLELGNLKMEALALKQFAQRSGRVGGSRRGLKHAYCG